MKSLKSLSKISYVLIFVCFFLPFVKSCLNESSKENKKPDTTKIAKQPTENKTIKGTINKDAGISKLNAKTDTASIPKTKKVEEKKKISTLERFYQFIIMPDNKNYSGIGYIINISLGCLLYSIPAFCLILCILGFIIISREKPKYLSIFIISVTGFILLVILILMDGRMNIEKLLYGFWIMISLFLVSSVMNWFLYINNKRNLESNI